MYTTEPEQKELLARTIAATDIETEASDFTADGQVVLAGGQRRVPARKAAGTYCMVYGVMGKKSCVSYVFCVCLCCFLCVCVLCALACCLALLCTRLRVACRVTSGHITCFVS